MAAYYQVVRYKIENGVRTQPTVVSTNPDWYGAETIVVAATTDTGMSPGTYEYSLQLKADIFNVLIAYNATALTAVVAKR